MNEKVLIVDDEEKITSIVAAYLENEGYQVDIADNGPDALLKNEGFQADIIVLDLMLPGLSGEEVCQKIRQTSDVPILMLTAKRDEEDRINGLYIGADDYLVKPFS